MRQSPAAGPDPATLNRASRNGDRFSKAPAAWPSTPKWPCSAMLAIVWPTSGPRGASPTQTTAIGARLPAKRLDRVGLGPIRKGIGRSGRALLAKSLDAGDEVANLRFPGLRRRVSGRPPCPDSRRDGAGNDEIAGAEAVEGQGDLGIEVAAMAQQGARGGRQGRDRKSTR